MSFYLGKDNSNNSILHITQGTTAESSMKGGELSTTTFHSGSSLSSAVVIPVTLMKRYMYWEFSYYGYVDRPNWHKINGIYIGDAEGESDSYFNFDNYYAEIPITSVYVYNIPSAYAAEYRNSVVTGSNYILYLDSNYKVVQDASASRMVGSQASSSGITYETYLSIGQVGFMELHRENLPSLGTVRYIVILKPNFYPALSGACKVDNTGIYIGGKDVFAGKTVVTNSPNADIPIFDNLGIMTTTTTNRPGISVTSENNKTLIKKDGRILFDSTYSYFRSINPKQTLSIETPTGSSGQTKYICDLNGDYVSIDSGSLGYGQLISTQFNEYPIPAGTYSCNTYQNILIDAYSISSKGLTLGFALYYLIIQNNKLYYYCRTLGGGSWNYGTLDLKLKIF